MLLGISRGLEKTHASLSLVRQSIYVQGVAAACRVRFFGRGHSQMTSAERGREGVTQILTQ